MRKLLPYAGVAVILGLLALLVLPVFAAPAGSWVTDFTLFNLNSSAVANVSIDSYVMCEGACAPASAVPVASPVIPAGGSYYYNPALDPTFPADFAGSIVVQSDQPLAGTVTLANDQIGTAYASDAYSAVPNPATSVNLPIIMSHLGVWNTRITVQNAGSANTDVTIHYVGAGAPPDGSINGLPPNMMAMTDQFDLTGITNFNGSAIVSASEPLAVVVEEYKTSGGTLVTYNGVPSTDADTTIYMPGYIAQGVWATDFTVVNTTASAADVTVTFSGVANTLGFSVPANGAAYVNAQAGVYPTGHTGTAPTTNYYGAATIASTEDVVVVYNISNSFGGAGNLPIGYVGFPASAANNTVVVPLIENMYSTGWITTYSVQSVDGTPANLTLTYSGNLPPSAACNPNCAYTMTSASHTFNQGSDGHVPTGFLGGVTVASDKPIVVIADQANTTFVNYQGGDSAAGFVGFSAP